MRGQAGLEGLEPPECWNQNPVPYHLAKAQYRDDMWYYTQLKCKLQVFFKKKLYFLTVQPYGFANTQAELLRIIAETGRLCVSAAYLPPFLRIKTGNPSLYCFIIKG